MVIITTRIFNKLFVIANGTYIMYSMYRNYKIKEIRKKDIYIKCKPILIKNPEILHYFGIINEIQLTNLSELNLNYINFDILNNAEFLIVGDKRTGKVSIRYFLSDQKMLRKFINTQNETYEHFLKINNPKNQDSQNKNISEFLFFDIQKKRSLADADKIAAANLNLSNDINTVVFNDKKRKNVDDIYHKIINFYYFNQVSKFTAPHDFDTSKLNELENFYSKYKQHLEEKYNSEVGNNLSEVNIKEDYKQMFSPLYSYFLNFLETKSKNKFKNDILVQDIFIKKNFKYYSITPQKYAGKEYESLNTLYFNDYNNLKYNSDFRESKQVEIFRIASEILKEKTIVKQYFELAKNENKNKNIVFDKEDYRNKDFDYGYNYNFIEEIFDSLQMDWRINYMIFGSLFFTVYYLIYTIFLLRYTRPIERNGLKLARFMNREKGYKLSNSYFYYYTLRSPMFLNYDRYIKMSILDAATIDKSRAIIILNQMNQNVDILEYGKRSNQNSENLINKI